MINQELIVENLCNKGFHIIDNFLSLDCYQGLRGYAQEMNLQNQFKQAKIGQKSQSQHNVTIRSDSILWIDEDSSSPEIQQYIEKMSQLALLFNKHLYLGLAELELHFAVYQPGSFYKKHVDQFATSKTRKISCVYYLNENWQPEFSGELSLYDTENNLIQTVQPLGNRLICFNSELPHEVNSTTQTRYSIATWMKTRSLVAI